MSAERDTRSELVSGVLTRSGVGGIAHGFGTRDARERALVRPVQVHGSRVAVVDPESPPPGEADGLVCTTPGLAIAVVTADCVPALIASADGAAVAALHAGWRGLASGVLEAGVAALRERAQGALVAAIGPAAGPCCYEVDAPVLDALSAAYPDALPGRLRPSRPGHAFLDLAGLARDALVASGLAPDAVECLDACTICDAERFHSYRRDGPSAGRLCHWISCGAKNGPGTLRA